MSFLRPYFEKQLKGKSRRFVFLFLIFVSLPSAYIIGIVFPNTIENTVGRGLKVRDGISIKEQQLLNENHDLLNLIPSESEYLNTSATKEELYEILKTIELLIEINPENPRYLTDAGKVQFHFSMKQIDDKEIMSNLGSAFQRFTKANTLLTDKSRAERGLAYVHMRLMEYDVKNEKTHWLNSVAYFSKLNSLTSTDSNVREILLGNEEFTLPQD